MITSLLTALSCTMPVPQGPNVLFFDDTFANGTWSTSHIVVGPGTASATSAQVQVGNPAPALRVTHTIAGGGVWTTVWATHLMNGAVHDPAANGAVGHVDFWLDYRSAINQRVYATIAQGNHVYISPVATWLTGTIGPVWRTRGPDTLAAGDFIELLPDGSYVYSNHPDFTTTGAPLGFGFTTGNTGAGTSTLACDFDNFRVGLNGVASAAAARPGSPPNPDVFRPVGGHGPVIGTTWSTALDHSTFLPNATLDFVAFAFAPVNQTTPYGTLLGAPIAAGYGVVAGQPFTLTVPNASTLLGATFHLQAGAGDPAQSAFQLTNALDVTIGTY